MKTKKLSGRALDYAVALAEGYIASGAYAVSRDGFLCSASGAEFRPTMAMTTAGDDIIDRELIGTDAGDGSFKGNKKWQAWMPGEQVFLAKDEITGATRREAAMRCYVLSKLGAEVEIPGELG